jgi:hypothetical protein
MSDVEDPELYAAFPLGEFMKTELGKWIETNCEDPRYSVRPDVNTYGYRVIVYGEVDDICATEFYLKFHNVQ